MENVSKLREEMVEVFKNLKARKIDVHQAKAFVGVSNSILKTASIEADYNKFLGEKKKIKFLESK